MSEAVTVQLIVLRHAKSAWPAGVSDTDRPLSDRGRADATAAGEWLAQSCGIPDVVSVSPALRTVSTWERVAEQLPHEPSDVDVNPLVYEATVAQLLDVIGLWPASARTGLLIGHNPGLEDLVCHLAGLRTVRDAGGVVRPLDKFATCTAAVLTVHSPWSEVSGAASADISLVALHKCRA